MTREDIFKAINGHSDGQFLVVPKNFDANTRDGWFSIIKEIRIVEYQKTKCRARVLWLQISLLLAEEATKKKVFMRIGDRNYCGTEDKNLEILEDFDFACGWPRLSGT